MAEMCWPDCPTFCQEPREFRSIDAPVAAVGLDRVTLPRFDPAAHGAPRDAELTRHRTGGEEQRIRGTEFSIGGA